MKIFLLKIWLPRLALYLAHNKGDIIKLLIQSIQVAETRYPTQTNNSHRALRLAYVKDRATALLIDISAWAVNAIIEMLLAHRRILTAGGTP